MLNAIVWYRMERFLYLHKVPLLPAAIRTIIFILYNCRVPYTADIGDGTTFIAKGIGASIHSRSVIGANCRIGIGVKIVGKSPFREVAIIGDNVWIGPGAVIVGPVRIEDDVVIAPNAVVTKSVRKKTIAGGIPARPIGSVDDLDYDILENPSYKEGTSEYM